MFRELAVSYLDRDDLAHVNPDAGSTALGKGVAEDQAVRDKSHAPTPVPAQSLVSRGMTRGRIKNQNLLLVSDTQPQTFNPVASMQSSVTALKTATALKTDPAATALNAAELDPIPSPPPSKDAGTLRAEAQMKGYTGDHAPSATTSRWSVTAPA